MYKRRKNDDSSPPTPAPAPAPAPPPAVKKTIEVVWDDATTNVKYKSLPVKNEPDAQKAVNSTLNALATLTSKILYKLITGLELIEAPISVKLSLDPASTEKDNSFGNNFTVDNAELEIIVSPNKNLAETKEEVRMFLLEQFSLFLDNYMLLPENEYVTIEDLEFILEQ